MEIKFIYRRYYTVVNFLILSCDDFSDLNGKEKFFSWKKKNIKK